MKNEIWKDVEEFENKYEISNFGRLRNKSNNKLSNFQNNGNGYLQFYIQINNRRIVKYVHRLVGKYFIENVLLKKEINHIDGNKSNNNSDNLEWVSMKENRIHAVEKGLMKKGEFHHFSKLKKNQIIAIRRLFSINPKFNKCQVARKLNISDSTIHKIIRNQRWSHIKQI